MICTWKIEHMEKYPDHAGVPDVVATIHWRVVASADGQSAEAYSSIALPFDPAAPFTPLAELTEAQVIGWVKAAINQSAVPEDQGGRHRPTVAEIEEGLAAEIAMRAAPAIAAAPLPWA